MKTMYNFHNCKLLNSFSTFHVNLDANFFLKKIYISQISLVDTLGEQGAFQVQMLKIFFFIKKSQLYGVSTEYLS